MKLFDLSHGECPLILSMPHPGTELPPEVRPYLNAAGLSMADTDWHMQKLFQFAEAFAPSVIAACLSRYVIDLNRDPSGMSLYPGQATTGLVPETDFDGIPLWDRLPDAAEVERRKALYFAPYHDALAAEIARVKARHGYAVLLDCHSIRSVIPRLFDGILPTLNLGTNGGASCAAEIHNAAADACASSGFRFAVNGRFKGGWITRRYGSPAERVHAVQMEITQSAYLAAEQPPWSFDASRAAPLQSVLKRLITAILDAARKT